MTDTTAGEGVITDAQAMIVGKAILDAHGVWEIENNRKGGQNPWQREHCMTLGRAAILAAQPSAGAQGEACSHTFNYRSGPVKTCPLCGQTHWSPATPSQPDTGDVAALREALSECQRVFADYAEMHRHKLTHMLTEHQRKDVHRKIERNRDMSDMCLAALSKPNAPGAA